MKSSIRLRASSMVLNERALSSSVLRVPSRPKNSTRAHSKPSMMLATGSTTSLPISTIQIDCIRLWAISHPLSLKQHSLRQTRTEPKHENHCNRNYRVSPKGCSPVHYIILHSHPIGKSAPLSQTLAETHDSGNGFRAAAWTGSAGQVRRWREF